MSEYISCEWLENGMDFDVGVYGSPIDWEEFWKLKNHYRNIQKSGQTVKECTDCVFLRKDNWEEGNHIKSVIFDHFTRCNCDCVYCYTHDDKYKYNTLKSYNVMPIIRDMVERGIFVPGGQIGFGGGEPTMLEEFEELINYLLDHGFDNISIQ